MIIRSETPADIEALSALITRAFATAKLASGTEAAVVTRLRADGGLMLSRLAEAEGQLLGQIAASPATIGGQGGWACIGPLAVAPEAQGQGIGSALMHDALAILAARGAAGAVLVGDPGYYTRFGFQPDCGVELAGIPGCYVMAKPLGEPLATGALVCHPALMP